MLNFPDPEEDKEEIIETLRVAPSMVPLLEKSGIKLRRNQRLPSPPNVCEEWWSQSERLVKKGRLPRTRYGLGYCPFTSCEGNEEDEDAPEVVTCHAICAGEDWGHEYDDEMSSDE